jgi:hypothetical protein
MERFQKYAVGEHMSAVVIHAVIAYSTQKTNSEMAAIRCDRAWRNLRN